MLLALLFRRNTLPSEELSAFVQPFNMFEFLMFLGTLAALLCRCNIVPSIEVSAALHSILSECLTMSFCISQDCDAFFGSEELTEILGCF